MADDEEFDGRKSDEARFREPKQRGGRRDKRGLHPNSLANLKKAPAWQPGTSGNPGGRPKSLVEITMLARSKSADAIKTLEEIMLNVEAPFRDRVAAAIALLDRGCGRPPVPVGVVHDPGMSPLTIEGQIDGEVNGSTMLLRAARAERTDGRLAAQLRAEADRLENKHDAEERAREARYADAAKRMARGEDIDPMVRMLLEARANSTKEKAKQNGSDRP